MSIKAIIFDMDGVLIDSEPLHFAAFEKLLAEHGLLYSQEFNQRFLGRTDLTIGRAIIEELGLDCSLEELVDKKDRIFYRLLIESASPLPGVLSLIDKARERSLPLAVASSSKLETIKLILKCLAVAERFDAIASGEEVEEGKPSPDVFLLAARRLGVDPASCLVLEDTDNGVRAAKSAGMTCIAVPCTATRHQAHEGADARLHSTADLNLEDWLSRP